MAAEELGDVALVVCFERAYRIPVGLGAVEGRDQVIIKGQHSSTITGFGVDCSPYSIVEIEWSVCRERRIGTHRTGRDERLGTVEREVDTERLT